MRWQVWVRREGEVFQEHYVALSRNEAAGAVYRWMVATSPEPWIVNGPKETPIKDPGGVVRGALFEAGHGRSFVEALVASEEFGLQYWLELAGGPPFSFRFRGDEEPFFASVGGHRARCKWSRHPNPAVKTLDFSASMRAPDGREYFYKDAVPSEIAARSTGVWFETMAFGLRDAREKLGVPEPAPEWQRRIEEGRAVIEPAHFQRQAQAGQIVEPWLRTRISLERPGFTIELDPEAAKLLAPSRVAEELDAAWRSWASQTMEKLTDGQFAQPESPLQKLATDLATALDRLRCAVAKRLAAEDSVASCLASAGRVLADAAKRGIKP